MFERERRQAQDKIKSIVEKQDPLTLADLAVIRDLISLIDDCLKVTTFANGRDPIYRNKLFHTKGAEYER